MPLWILRRMNISSYPLRRGRAQENKRVDPWILGKNRFIAEVYGIRPESNLTSRNNPFKMEINKILNADILDIIIEGKNKEYGAYDLRKTYNRRLWKAIIG